VKGGFFLRKKPLECVLSVYTNSETAIAGLCGKLNRGKPQSGQIGSRSVLLEVIA
jgi:hypothetical protein